MPNVDEAWSRDRIPDQTGRTAVITGVGAVGRTGRLDLLINNAGLIVPGGHAENSVGWELNFATNYVGGFLLPATCCRCTATWRAHASSRCRRWPTGTYGTCGGPTRTPPTCTDMRRTGSRSWRA